MDLLPPLRFVAVGQCMEHQGSTRLVLEKKCRHCSKYAFLLGFSFNLVQCTVYFEPLRQVKVLTHSFGHGCKVMRLDTQPVISTCRTYTSILASIYHSLTRQPYQCEPFHRDQCYDRLAIFDSRLPLWQEPKYFGFTAQPESSDVCTQAPFRGSVSFSPFLGQNDADSQNDAYLTPTNISSISAILP